MPQPEFVEDTFFPATISETVECIMTSLGMYKREEVFCFYPITFLPVYPPPATDEDQQGKKGTHNSDSVKKPTGSERRRDNSKGDQKTNGCTDKCLIQINHVTDERAKATSAPTTTMKSRMFQRSLK